MKVERRRVRGAWASVGGAAGLLGLLACAGVTAGCASSSPKYDRLAAQTSKPGWVVGDQLGESLCPIPLADRPSPGPRAVSAASNKSDE